MADNYHEMALLSKLKAVVASYDYNERFAAFRWAIISDQRNDIGACSDFHTRTMLTFQGNLDTGDGCTHMSTILVHFNNLERCYRVNTSQFQFLLELTYYSCSGFFEQCAKQRVISTFLLFLNIFTYFNIRSFWKGCFEN